MKIPCFIYNLLLVLSKIQFILQQPFFIRFLYIRRILKYITIFIAFSISKNTCHFNFFEIPGNSFVFHRVQTIIVQQMTCTRFVFILNHNNTSDSKQEIVYHKDILIDIQNICLYNKINTNICFETVRE